MNGWPINRYQVSQFKTALKYALLLIVAVFFIGNIAAMLFIKRIKVDPKHYVIRNGFPFFTSADHYLNLVSGYRHDFGTKIHIYTLRNGQSYWDVARQFRVSIDTILAANPFLTSLNAKEGTRIVVPQEEGVLAPLDNFWDAYRMKSLLGKNYRIRGDYLQSLFRLFSPDDIRFAFYPAARPLLVNPELQSLYNTRRIFQNPVKSGLYSSLYGDRVDPMREGMAFHNGVDIQERMGTPIYPIREGMVSITGWMDGYGLTVVILHDEGYISMYGHCSSIKVKKGDWVKKDRAIAHVGSTGRSTGPHLHFMVLRHGKMINPLLFIW